MPAKKSSKWITHVKAYSKANNCSYGDAMSRAKSSYQKGGGIMDTARNANNWLKQHKVVSRGANFLVSSGIAGKHAGRIGRIGNFADKHGYGK